MTPAASQSLMTAAEFARKHSGDHVELVKGVVKQLSGLYAREAKINAEVAFALFDYARESGLGTVISNDSFVRIPGYPETVRGGDVCFYSYTRLPKGSIPEGFPDAAPELIVEIRSWPDTWLEMLTKTFEFLSAGVTAVVVVDADTSSATVFRSEARPEVFEEDEELTLPDILPGFSVPVRKFFE